MPVDSRCLVWIALCCGPVIAQQGEKAAPDPALLEFLGEFETEAGDWIDPEELEDEIYAEPRDETD